MPRLFVTVAVALCGCKAAPDGPSPDGSNARQDVRADSVLPAGHSILLYTGAGGGGPATDVYLQKVLDAYQAAGIDAHAADTVPADFTLRDAAMVFVNPLQTLAADASAAALDLVHRGGRVVVVMEHCKNGCWGNAAVDNALLASLGSLIVLVGTVARRSRRHTCRSVQRP